MVRLKAIRRSRKITHFYKFQFQYGAIKRIDNGNGIALTELFQFQYGAIKSTY